MLLGVSKILSNTVYEKMAGSKDSIYELKCTFIQHDKNIEIKPQEIEQLTIEQNFVGSTIDTTMLRAKFFPQDILSLIENHQDLKCVLVQTRWDRNFYGPGNNDEPDIYEFKVLLANPNDIKKQATAALMKKTESTDFDRDQLYTPISLDMQLIPENSHKLLKTKVNCILADTNMQSVCMYLIKLFDIENAYISPVDNEKKYETVIIPGLMDMKDIFSYLQEKYGIYQKGISQYFDGSRFYLYPPFDTNPDKEEILHIYKLPSKSVDGGAQYFNKKDNELHIVIFSDVKSYNSSEKGSENIGNAVSVRQGDASIDVSHTVSNDGKITLNPQSTIIAKVNSSSTNTSSQVNTRYDGTTGNIFDKLSTISSEQMEHITFSWIHAKPYLIIPGMKCVFHYDDTEANVENKEEQYTVTPGIVEYAKYVLTIHGKPHGPIYKWNCTLVISVPPKELNENQVQQAIPNK